MTGPTQVAGPPLQVVRFTAGDGEFAVDVARAVEVMTADRLVPLPDPGPDVVGIVDRGGKAVAVVAVLGSFPGPGSDHILVVSDGADLVGLLVGHVHAVTTVPAGLVGDAPPGQLRAIVEAVIPGEALTPGEASLVMVIDPRALPGLVQR